jgi:hypothetical protein
MLQLAYTQEKLAYDPQLKQLVWRTKGACIGKIAGAPHGKRRVVRIGGQRYSLTDVAWLLHTGNWPSAPTETIDGDEKDLRLENLRFVVEQPKKQTPSGGWSEANRAAASAKEQSARRTSPTGVKGVLPYAGGRFKAQVYTAGKCKHLGIFDSIAQASNAIDQWHAVERKRLRELGQLKPFG